MGDPCCDDDSEAFEKTHTPVHDLLHALAWEIAEEARWLHCTKLLKRWLLLTVGYYVLPGSLAHMQVHWRVNESMVTTLTRMLEADKNNYTARRKLRLLRIVQNLSTPEAEHEIACHLIGVKSADDILYAALGDKSKNAPRATIADFAHPDTSPIAVGLRHLTKLLDEFGEDADGWQLLRFTHSREFGAPKLRKAARRELVQLHCGIVDQFEIRFGKPPYTTCVCLTQGVDRATVNATLRRFRDDDPVECHGPLAVFFARWRFFTRSDLESCDDGHASRCQAHGHRDRPARARPRSYETGPIGRRARPQRHRLGQ